jgi:hypothetical protein
VYRNLAERGLADPREQLDKAWRARQLTEGMWVVTLKYVMRGRESEAVWEYDETAGELRARGRLAAQLGFREPTRRAPRASTSAGRAKPATRAKTAAKAKAPTTARRSSSRQASKRVAAARKAAAARMVSDAERATRRNAALARKAANRPVVLPPRQPVEPPPPLEPVLIDESLDEPSAGGDELLELSRDDTEPAAAEVDVEVEVEEEVEVEVEVEPEEDVEVEVEEERPSRRREPLRARPPEAASSAEQARRRVRIRPPADDEVQASEGNGPVFRSDLAQPVSDRPSFPRSNAGPTPAPPLSMRLQPIEPPRGRRRLRPLRGR